MRPRKGREPDAPRTVPASAPKWVTQELLDQTLRVWQKYYHEPLTSQDALDMIARVGQLHEVTNGSARTCETVRRPGQGQQP